MANTSKLEFFQRNDEASVTAKLRYESIIDATLERTVDYVAEELAKEILKKHRARLLNSIKPRHIRNAAIKIVTEEITKNMELELKYKKKYDI